MSPAVGLGGGRIRVCCYPHGNKWRRGWTVVWRVTCPGRVSCGSAASRPEPPARSPEEAGRCRVGVPGGGAGAAGRPLRASLAADVLRAAGAPVPLFAEAAGLPQAGQGGRTADLPGHLVAGHVVPVVGGRPAAARRDPGAVRHLAADGPALRPGRAGELRLLRRALALVLGPEAVPAHHRRGNAGGLVPG